MYRKYPENEQYYYFTCEVRGNCKNLRHRIAIQTTSKNKNCFWRRIKLNKKTIQLSCGDSQQTHITSSNRRRLWILADHKLSIRKNQTTVALYQYERKIDYKINFLYKTRIIGEAIEIEKEGTLSEMMT